jgi:hypothetical protein
MADYSQITDPSLQTRVRERYQRQTTALQAMGFRHLAYCLEVMGAFSALLQLPVLVLAGVHREVLVVRRPLRLAAANLLLSHNDPPSIALCMGMGVKFYTSFSDGTLLISSDFTSHAVPRPGSRIVRLLPSATLGETWNVHKVRASELATDARRLPLSVDFRDYLEMSRVEEDLSQYQ